MRSAARREAGQGVTRAMVFLVLAVTLVVRLLHLRYALNSPLTYQPGPDEDFYFRFGKAVAARGMVGPRQYCAHAVAAAGVGDALAVGCHHDLRGRGLLGPLRHAHDHGQAADVGQRLVGQAGGGEPRGNEDGETHGALYTSGVRGGRRSS